MARPLGRTIRRTEWLSSWLAHGFLPLVSTPRVEQLEMASSPLDAYSVDASATVGSTPFGVLEKRCSATR